MQGRGNGKTVLTLTKQDARSTAKISGHDREGKTIKEELEGARRHICQIRIPVKWSLDRVKLMVDYEDL